MSEQKDNSYYFSLDFIIKLLSKVNYQMDEETMSTWFVLLLLIQSQGKLKVLKILSNYLTKQHTREKLKGTVRYLIRKVVKDEEEKIELYAAEKLGLTDAQRKQLKKLARGSHTPNHLKQRSSIILLHFAGKNISQIARECNCTRDTVRKWITRWQNAAADLHIIEKERPFKLKSAVQSVLEDAYRCGSPGKFTIEQIAHIIYLALHTNPEDLGIPQTHWTNESLAKQAAELDIVDSISTSRVNAILNELDLKPHRYRMWLNPDIEDEEEYHRQVKLVCDLYKNAETLEKMGIHLICSDEMTGVQALEHLHPKHPAGIGKAELVEHGYDRHGTTGIIASRFVTTGQIEAIVKKGRTEEDFAKHIENVISQDETKNYIFIVDQLNTHKSESLVRLAAQYEGIDPDTLGEKEKSGILKSMKTRSEFLTDPERKLRFVYVPKHSSWLNQIEIWFSIIKRRILNRRSSNTSVEELEERIRFFIEHYNTHLAKPFNWTYGGKLLNENEAQVA